MPTLSQRCISGFCAHARALALSLVVACFKLQSRQNPVSAILTAAFISMPVPKNWDFTGDISPERRGAISAAGRRGGSKNHLQRNHLVLILGMACSNLSGTLKLAQERAWTNPCKNGEFVHSQDEYMMLGNDGNYRPCRRFTCCPFPLSPLAPHPLQATMASRRMPRASTTT